MVVSAAPRSELEQRSKRPGDRWPGCHAKRDLELPWNRAVALLLKFHRTPQMRSLPPVTNVGRELIFHFANGTQQGSCNKTGIKEARYQSHGQRKGRKRLDLLSALADNYRNIQVNEPIKRGN